MCGAAHQVHIKVLDWLHIKWFPSSSPDQISIYQAVFTYVTIREGHSLGVQWFLRKLATPVQPSVLALLSKAADQHP